MHALDSCRRLGDHPRQMPEGLLGSDGLPSGTPSSREGAVPEPALAGLAGFVSVIVGMGVSWSDVRWGRSDSALEAFPFLNTRNSR